MSSDNNRWDWKTSFEDLLKYILERGYRFELEDNGRADFTLRIFMTSTTYTVKFLGDRVENYSFIKQRIELLERVFRFEPKSAAHRQHEL